MTPPTARRRRGLLRWPLLALAVAALVAAACGQPPSPEGWAPAHAVTVNANGFVLVTHSGRLYALGGQTRTDITSNYAWRFPPVDRSVYPISEYNVQDLSARIDALTGIDDATRAQLKKLLAGARLSGPTGKAFKDAVNASAAPPAQRSALTAAYDRTVTFENGEFSRIQAFYGDIGISSDQKTAFIASFKGAVAALDLATGYTRWVQDLGVGTVGGIAVDGSTIYLGTKGKQLFAIDAATGLPKWRFPTRGEVWATPTIDAGTIYVSSLDGSVYALDAAGKQKWVFSGAGAGIAARPVVAGGVVYAGAFDSKLYALNAADGAVLWTLKGDNWFWASAVVQGGVVYAASLGGKVYAVDAKTGQARWSTPYDAGAPIRSTPVIAGDALIVAARDGRVHKLDLTAGKAAAPPVLLAAGATVLADVATNTGATAIYVVPTSKTLFVLDDQLQFKSVPLP